MFAGLSQPAEPNCAAAYLPVATSTLHRSFDVITVRAIVLARSLQIGNIIRQNRDQFPSVLTSIAEHVNVIAAARVLVQWNLSVFPSHGMIPMYLTGPIGSGNASSLVSC